MEMEIDAAMAAALKAAADAARVAVRAAAWQGGAGRQYPNPCLKCQWLQTLN